MKLSVIIITYNEIYNIENCLNSLNFATEIVIIDNGSTDGTVALAENLGAKVVSVKDWPGFGKQKNRALNCASGDWILSIDADERVSDELREEILNTVESNRDEVYAIPRKTNFCGEWINHCGWSPDYVVRLFPRQSARFSDDLVHERLIPLRPNVETVRLKQHLLHYSYPDLRNVWAKMESYSKAWALQQFQNGKRVSLYRAIASSVFAFFRSYIVRLGFLDGVMGFVVCSMQAQMTFWKYFQLYHLWRVEGNRS